MEVENRGYQSEYAQCTAEFYLKPSLKCLLLRMLDADSTLEQSAEQEWPAQQHFHPKHHCFQKATLENYLQPGSKSWFSTIAEIISLLSRSQEANSETFFSVNFKSAMHKDQKVHFQHKAVVLIWRFYAQKILHWSRTVHKVKNYTPPCSTSEVLTN